jgi:dTDP-glucose 4,6-dehydratase
VRYANVLGSMFGLDPDQAGALVVNSDSPHLLAVSRTYNIPAGNERANREVVAALLKHLGKPWSLVRSVADRPGHDRRYAMDGDKLAALGWRHRVPFEEGLAATVDWFLANEAWWRPIKSGEWRDYYRRQYEARLATSRDAG